MSLLHKLNKDMLIKIIETVKENEKIENKTTDQLKEMEKNISKELVERGKLSDVEILGNLMLKLSLTKSHSGLRYTIMIILFFYSIHLYFINFNII